MLLQARPPLVFALQPTGDYITLRHPCSAKQRLPASSRGGSCFPAKGEEQRGELCLRLSKPFSWKGFLQTARNPSERPSVSGHVSAEPPNHCYRPGREQRQRPPITTSTLHGGAPLLSPSLSTPEVIIRSFMEELIDSNLPLPEDERHSGKSNKTSQSSDESRSSNT